MVNRKKCTAFTLENVVQLWHYNTTEELMVMPQIIPIRDLKNTSEISRMCQEATEPIYITKNGYDDMVIMSVKNVRRKIIYVGCA